MSERAIIDSDIPFLPKIPSDWEVVPLFCCFDENKKKNLDLQETQVLSLSYGKLIDRNVESNFGLLPESFDTYQIISEGYIILRLTDLQNDQRSLRVGISPKKGIITSAYVGLKPREIIFPKYGYYFLHTYDIEKVFYNLGAGVRQSLKYSELKRLPAVVPPLPIQKTIAAYLDKETARIDTLIAKKERQIELLEEKRQAIITRAITKGLDSNVKMKDSGIEWIGEIPEGWSIRRLSFSASFISGATPDKGNDAYWSGEIPWVSPKDMKCRYIDDSIDHLTIDAIKESGLRTVKSDMILVVVRGMILAHSFPVAIATKELTINQDIKALRFDQKFETEFAAYLLTAFEKVVVSQYTDESAHGTKAIRMDNWKNFPLICPTMEDQRRIIAFLAKRTNQIETTIRQIKTSCELLREYRSSLITAAVSGQINIKQEVVK